MLSISNYNTIILSFPINNKLNHRRQTQSLVVAAASIHHDSLRVLEWDKLSDLVSSFATTSLGRHALKDQLWSQNRTYEESLKLLEETNAAVEMHKHGSCRLHFGHIDAMLAQTGIQNARRTIPVTGHEARAVFALLQSADTLQGDLKATIKQGKDWYSRFMPLTEVIMEFVINRSLIKVIEQVIDDDGSIKDSASPELRKARQQVQVLERKVEQLMESLIRSEGSETSILVVHKSGFYTENKFQGSVVVQIQLDVDDIENILNSLVQLDVINARATYGISFGGSNPQIFLPDRNSSCSAESFLTRNENSNGPLPNNREWILYLPKAYHPLLLNSHRANSKKAKEDVATSVAALDKAQPQPVPVDFLVSSKTRVIVITGPNTGGKTICLKTVGLAAMMAKSGLYVLASESVQIPWFDSVFADIGDEQSLSQSLSTFSGHLKQISNIKLQSTMQSLVLLDEVGAGTNPLEGAALGMSLLESFAQDGCLLTIATTHHGELKTLKYSNEAFENACMEFDEVNLKPTYKVLWGIPGRSNAINIAERLGLPSVVIDTARKLYGSSSAEIDEVITDMEKLKQDYHERLTEADYYLMQSRGLHSSLLNTRRKIAEHSTSLKFKKMRDVSEAAAMARSTVHKKVRELDASAKKTSQYNKAIKSSHVSTTNNLHTAAADNKKPTITDRRPADVKKIGKSSKDRSGVPKVGDTVHVSSLGKKVTVLEVDSSKGEILVQAGIMKLKLKVTDIQRL
ncbi:endonuclease MutS2 isoform X3 [Trifolium pratense]|uniref:endonuclease MutS2 isoform X3 n=1 Tax=Trifolium pratense TaxID=57577 RepID=UPI001E69357E|nr:endonuclease MutS2 isoform X3 [Trifolium pratense]